MSLAGSSESTNGPHIGHVGISGYLVVVISSLVQLKCSTVPSVLSTAVCTPVHLCNVSCLMR